jgi:hypothetical protein
VDLANSQHRLVLPKLSPEEHHQHGHNTERK